MPILFQEVDLDQVKEILYRRGYGPASSSTYALCFNKPTGKVFSDGTPQRMPLPGLTETQLKHILQYSENVEDAANRIERIMLGQDMMAVDNVKVNGYPQVSAPSLSLDEIQRLVTNRVECEVSKIVGEAMKAWEPTIAAIKRELIELRRDVEEGKERLPKKMGRPVGSKNKPKGKPAPEITVPEVDEDGPITHF